LLPDSSWDVASALLSVFFSLPQETKHAAVSSETRMKQISFFIWHLSHIIINN
jgi:hypothetical protein